MYYRAGAPIVAHATQSVPSSQERNDWEFSNQRRFVADASTQFNKQNWDSLGSVDYVHREVDTASSIFPSIAAVIRSCLSVVLNAESVNLWPPVDNGYEWLESCELDMLPKGSKSRVVLAGLTYPLAPIRICVLGKDYMHAVSLLSAMDVFPDNVSWPSTESSIDVSEYEIP